MNASLAENHSKNELKIEEKTQHIKNLNSTIEEKNKELIIVKENEVT